MKTKTFLTIPVNFLTDNPESVKMERKMLFFSQKLAGTRYIKEDYTIGIIIQ